MSSTHTITTQYAVGASVIIAAASGETDIDQVSFDGTIAATTTDYVIDLAFPYANMKSFLLYSDQDVTLHTNAADGTGGNNFTLKAGEPQVWSAASGLANPFTHDVTKFYSDNAGSVIANVKIYALYH